jgi:hypothetical protein
MRDPPAKWRKIQWIPLCGHSLYIFGHMAIIEDDNCRAMSVLRNVHY